MNDLMTKSFVSYVELKKQAVKDLEAGVVPDLEAGRGLTHAEEENLTQFFEEVGAIQSEMEDVSHLLHELQNLSGESKSAHSGKVLRGLRDRMDSDMLTILRKAKIIKARLEALDGSNVSSRAGSHVDRTRMSVTNGLRVKLRESMNGFQSLREQIVAEHKDALRKKYFNATGEVATEELTDKMLSGSDQIGLMGGKGEVDLEIQERQKAVSDIQRSLLKLHQVFLDMAVMVETQEEHLNDIEENVVRAKEYISGGTDRLASAQALRRKSVTCWWIWALVLIVLLVCLILIFTIS